MIAKPRELVVDLFGNYVRHLGGSIQLGHLSQLLEIFGVEPATTRVTLSRMKKDCYFLTERHGREIQYRVTEKFISILDERQERIFTRSQPIWVGQWPLVVFGSGEVSQAEIRKLSARLESLGFAKLNGTSWICPRDLRESLRGEFGTSHGRILVSTMWTGSLDEDRGLAEEYWDLSEITTGYRQFIRRWQDEFGGKLTASTPRQAFVARVQLVTEYRNFSDRDPLMPLALLPEGWPSEEAFSCFTEMHRALGPQAMEQVSEVMFCRGVKRKDED